MRKLRLELDALVVETFETAAALAGAGTVRGNLRYNTVGNGSGCPEDTCTCEETSCYPETAVTVPVKAFPGVVIGADSDCNATDGVCTCQPIETCSCAAPGTGYY